MMGVGLRMGNSGGSGASPFNPLDPGGCVGWFDMQDSASYTQAGTVTSINNKASGVAWTEATTPPGYSATGFNGFPTMTFNGTTQKIISTEAVVFGAIAASAANTIFYVAKTNSLSLAGGAVVFGGGVSSGTNLRNINYWGMTGATAKNTYGGITSGGSSFSVLSSATANSNTNVSEFLNTGSVCSIITNGGTADPSAGAANSAGCSPTRCSIGCIPTVTPQGFWNGNIAEIIIYNSALSSTVRNQVRQYLGTKWGITVA